MTQENILENGEKQTLELLTLMAGMEDKGFLEKMTSDKIKPLKYSISQLYRRMHKHEACEVINRILSLLGIGRISLNFFETVFGDVNFSKVEEVKRRIEKFRWLCLLEFSDILEGFNIFSKEDEVLVNSWMRHFSRQARHSVPLMLERIEPQYLFALGYLAYEQVPRVGEERRKLKDLLEEAINSGLVRNPDDLANLAEKKGIGREKLHSLIDGAAIPEGPLLLQFPLAVWIYEYPGPEYKNYMEVLIAARNSCEIVNKEIVESIRFKGLQNTRAYLSAQNIDVYVATSMREPTDFVTNWAFVRALTENEELRDLNLTFFDPTQAYIPERIHKGILENFAIERASVTVYNAQETETFGKDAEAAISLAYGKPVIIYVPRMFGEEIEKKEMKKTFESIKRIFSDLDELSLKERGDFLIGLLKKDYLTKEETQGLSQPEKDKRHAIELVIEKQFPTLLNQLDVIEIRSALLTKGYYTTLLRKEELIKFCTEKIKKLEVRALLFRDIHPLTFQLSPIDAVARGVFVTRSVQQTAKLLRAIFEGTLEYEIREITKKVDGEELKTWVLCDVITNSPIRACPKNDMMRKELSELRSRRHAQQQRIQTKI
jgi:hypothetical protein